MSKRKIRGHIVIDSERCKGCKFCVLTCPKGCIVVAEEFNSFGYYPAKFEKIDACTGCAMCAVVCPDVAIEVYREE